MQKCLRRCTDNLGTVDFMREGILFARWSTIMEVIPQTERRLRKVSLSAVKYGHPCTAILQEVWTEYLTVRSLVAIRRVGCLIFVQGVEPAFHRKLNRLDQFSPFKFLSMSSFRSAAIVLSIAYASNLCCLCSCKFLSCYTFELSWGQSRATVEAFFQISYQASSKRI